MTKQEGTNRVSKGRVDVGGACEQFSGGFSASPVTSCVDLGMFLSILDVLIFKMG
jgi:hypothetical protein